eukprot:scaffold917_cov168-Ochromonas_danica.AAC.10
MQLIWKAFLFSLLFYTILAAVAKNSNNNKKKSEKSSSDPNDNKGLTPFFLQDPTDQMCLGPKGFTICDEKALWILTRRPGKKTYSLVSFHDPSKGVCLQQKTSFLGLFGSDQLTLGPCSSGKAKAWQWDFIDNSQVKLSSSGRCLVRGKHLKNSVSLGNCQKGDFTPLVYHPTAVHENGFYLKAADGSCFDGSRFRSCSSSSHANKLLWGMGVKYVGGEAKKYFFHFAPSERSNCLVAKGSKTEVGSCTSSQALGWAVADGQLSFKHGQQCVARNPDDTASLVKCSKGSEYISLEVRAFYTQEQLEQMLQNEVSFTS